MRGWLMGEVKVSQTFSYEDFPVESEEKNQAVEAALGESLREFLIPASLFLILIAAIALSVFVASSADDDETLLLKKNGQETTATYSGWDRSEKQSNLYWVHYLYTVDGVKYSHPELMLTENWDGPDMMTVTVCYDLANPSISKINMSECGTE